MWRFYPSLTSFSSKENMKAAQPILNKMFGRKKGSSFINLLRICKNMQHTDTLLTELCSFLNLVPQMGLACWFCWNPRNSVQYWTEIDWSDWKGCFQVWTNSSSPNLHLQSNGWSWDYGSWLAVLDLTYLTRIVLGTCRPEAPTGAQTAWTLECRSFWWRISLPKARKVPTLFCNETRVGCLTQGSEPSTWADVIDRSRLKWIELDRNRYK